MFYLSIVLEKLTKSLAAAFLGVRYA